MSCLPPDKTSTALRKSFIEVATAIKCGNSNDVLDKTLGGRLDHQAFASIPTLTAFACCYCCER